MQFVTKQPEYYESLEREILSVVRDEIYGPLVYELGENPGAVLNRMSDLLYAIERGRIYYEDGAFRGKFSASTTRELKEVGAKWKRDSFVIPLRSVPPELKTAMGVSETRFESTVNKVAKFLERVLPEEIADKISLEKVFSKTVNRVGKDIDAITKSMMVKPEFTRDQQLAIARRYTESLKLPIKDWTARETVKLRHEVEKTLKGGVRYDVLLKQIQRSYGATHAKAKFLARQETNLLVTEVQRERYTTIGLPDYTWKCAAGSPAHPVRPMHKRLDGKVFSWNNPPIVNEKGERKHPGQDYGCRCGARPVLRF